MKPIIIAVLCLFLQGVSGQSLSKLTITNGSITYFSAGQGEIIVFIHGGQEDYRVFMPQTELLSNEFQVVTYSRRYNFPNNNEINGEYNVKTEAADLKVLISMFDKPVHLVGHSYGGLIALEFAVRNPKMLKSLTLSEPALVNWLNDIPKCEFWYETVQEKLINETRDAFITKDTTLIMKELFEFFAGADIQNQIPPEVLSMLKANLREMEVLVNSPAGFDSPSPEDVKALDIPLMILTSEKTMPMLTCTNAKLIEIKPQATHHHLTEAGHEMWMTHPRELSVHISNFIKN
ncbi:alpha/beta fold hydrolase [Spongiimicrobium sp. 2-473A-2-J]|uniref:alpha/beta fold hydrolase n=1 Tax=Eudoraea algarum TaxID=3417568 RepID=UPI003D36B898